MNTTKPFYKSKTMLGNLVSVIGTLLIVTGVVEIPQGDLVAIANSVDSLIAVVSVLAGQLFSIYGRIVAKFQIQ